jgi:hypothetical protein
MDFEEILSALCENLVDGECYEFEDEIELDFLW